MTHLLTMGEPSSGVPECGSWRDQFVLRTIGHL